MFRHVGIVVRDLEAQLKFYKETLGFEVYYHKTEKGKFLEHILGGKKNIEAEIIKLGKNNKTIVELLFFAKNTNIIQEKEVFNTGYTHFAITVDNIEELSEKVNPINSPKVNDEGTFKVCFCKDPEGNLIELVQCVSK